MNLFSTQTYAPGYRLLKMEILNWGTFHDTVKIVRPEGNNSLLTGKNGSGKSTLIDALLTLMVPQNKHRFYNQSSGAESKGDRSETSYVVGEYGTIYEEETRKSEVKSLRSRKGTISILLATFRNGEGNCITIFQIRWFNSSGDLNRLYAIAQKELSIEGDFNEFDLSGQWKERLKQKINKDGRKIVTFFDGPKSYAERLTQVFGMRSEKGLKLFNYVVGVKVLDNISTFIQENMLEEEEYNQSYFALQNISEELQNANNNIEKAKVQLDLLSKVKNDYQAYQQTILALEITEPELNMLEFWYREEGKRLNEKELLSKKISQESFDKQVEELSKNKEEKEEERLKVDHQIRNNEVGNRLKELDQLINSKSELLNNRKNTLKQYNSFANQLQLSVDPSMDTFTDNQEKAIEQIKKYKNEGDQINFQLEEKNIRKRDIKKEIDEIADRIKYLKENQNKIPTERAALRAKIADHLNISPKILPFIGELISVKEEEKTIWEKTIENVLCNFAFNILVPETYFLKFHSYVVDNNLQHQVLYRKYIEGEEVFTTSFHENSLLHKIDFKPNTNYSSWFEKTLKREFDYRCFDQVKEFEQYNDKAISTNGNIKHAINAYEKNDALTKENYVLGWDNQKMINDLNIEYINLGDELKSIQNEIDDLERKRKKYNDTVTKLTTFHQKFESFTALDWRTPADELSVYNQEKEELQSESDEINLLRRRLDSLKKTIQDLNSELIELGYKSRDLKKDIKEVEGKIVKFDLFLKDALVVDTTSLVEKYNYLEEVDYHSINSIFSQLKNELKDRKNKLDKEQVTKASTLILSTRDFKEPKSDIIEKYQSWKSDVLDLPEVNKDTLSLDLVMDYLNYLDKLEKENLPKFEEEFKNHMQDTIRGGMTDFFQFFKRWEDDVCCE